MEKSAQFCFYASLHDFLSSSQRNKSPIIYSFSNAPAVKDAIEAIGIPHPEVASIFINGTAAGFSHPLHHLDQVEVFPAGYPSAPPNGYALCSPYPEPERFVLDVHLGKLARSLRMLGFDTLYENNYSDNAIAKIAEKDERIVLTRDIGLLKQKIIQWGYWLRSQQAEEQLAEVIRYFKLQAKFQPFSRCIACNGRIIKTLKENVADRLPSKTKQYFNEFFQCQSCRRVYWKGSHYERMQTFIMTVNAQINQGQ